MWWKKTPSLVKADKGIPEAALFLEQLEENKRRFDKSIALENSRLAGIRAWKVLVMNHMLAEEYRHPDGRRYRWHIAELSQICGIDAENVHESKTRFDNDRP